MPSPFERVLGAQLSTLPAPVRHLHSLDQPRATAGRADVRASDGWLARLLCWGAGLPRPGNVEVAVTFRPLPDGREHWHRRFGDRKYASTLGAGDGRDLGFLIERFGPFDLRFELIAGGGGLAWSLAGWRLLGITLPRSTVPRIECLESADGDRFTFDIDVTFPLIGWLIHYRGWLMPKADDQPLAA